MKNEQGVEGAVAAEEGDTVMGVEEGEEQKRDRGSDTRTPPFLFSVWGCLEAVGIRRRRVAVVVAEEESIPPKDIGSMDKIKCVVDYLCESTRCSDRLDFFADLLCHIYPEEEPTMETRVPVVITFGPRTGLKGHLLSEGHKSIKGGWLKFELKKEVKRRQKKKSMRAGTSQGGTDVHNNLSNRDSEEPPPKQFTSIFTRERPYNFRLMEPWAMGLGCRVNYQKPQWMETFEKHSEEVPDEWPTTIVHCTSCGDILKRKNQIHVHPQLQVIFCNKCRHVYNEGSFDVDDGVDDCIIYLSKALAIVPDDHLTVLKLARVYTFGKGDNKQALALLSKVLEVSPKIVVLACALAQFRDLSANETKSLTPLLYSERFIRGDVQHETFYQDVERFKSDKSLAPLISFASLLGDRLGETRRVVELLKGCLRPATPEKADKAVDTAENGTKYTPSEMHLFVSYKSPETSADSTSEMSIVAHLNSKAVRTVYIVAQAGDFEQLKSQIVEAYGQKLAAKLELFSLSRNPTYSDIFAFANNKLEPGSIIVIASKGVQFDQSLEKLIQHPFPKQSAFALLPYESDRLGIPHMQFAGGEFAALVLETPVTVRVDRYVGSYGSANFVTHRLQRNGIKVSSPSIGIRAVRLESERLKVPPDAMFDTVYEDGFSRVTDRFMNENDL